MGITATDIQRFVDMAGDGFAWAGVKGTSRPASDVRTKLRDDLLNRQGGICPVCGDDVTHAEFNHVVARGPKVKGFVAGNVFAGCASCNTDCKNEYGDGTDGGVIPLERFARPDVIPTEWTPFPVLRKM
jgi:5-methylcytosine-specific restriction endonuclease McrA